mgnify:CR=1 FL=1
MLVGEVRKIINSMRKHNRRAVVLPVELDVGGNKIDCVAYDVSLGGVRLKVDMPIEQDTCVLVNIRDKLSQVAKVVWSAEGFVGLSFNNNAKEIKADLGAFAMNLN